MRPDWRIGGHTWSRPIAPLILNDLQPRLAARRAHLRSCVWRPQGSGGAGRLPLPNSPARSFPDSVRSGAPKERRAKYSVIAWPPILRERAAMIRGIRLTTRAPARCTFILNSWVTNKLTLGASPDLDPHLIIIFHTEILGSILYSQVEFNLAGLGKLGRTAPP